MKLTWSSKYFDLNEIFLSENNRHILKMALAIFVFLVQNAVFVFEINDPGYQTNAVYYAQIMFFLNYNINIPKRNNHLNKQTKECDSTVRDSIAFCQ